MRIDVFTIFPQVYQPYLGTSILHRAIERGLVTVNLHNIRDWTTDRHHMTDDEPYGGGGGMVMKPEPIFTAVERVLGEDFGYPIILLTPQGRLFDQSVAFEFSEHKELALICGRYEGVDERVRQHLRDFLFGFATRDAGRVVRAYQGAGVLLPDADAPFVFMTTGRACAGSRR